MENENEIWKSKNEETITQSPILSCFLNDKLRGMINHRQYLSISIFQFPSFTFIMSVKSIPTHSAGWSNGLLSPPVRSSCVALRTTSDDFFNTFSHVIPPILLIHCIQCSFNSKTSSMNTSMNLFNQSSPQYLRHDELQLTIE